MNTERHGVSTGGGGGGGYRSYSLRHSSRSFASYADNSNAGASRKYGVSQSVPRGKTAYRCSCSILRLEFRVEKIRPGNTSNYSALLHFGTNFCDFTSNYFGKAYE